MKKTLIALAAVAVTGAAFAQVTISGTADVAYQKSDKDQSAFFSKDGKFVRNGNSTSVIRFSATEDLGGGMSAQGYYEVNVNPAAAAGVNSSQSYVGLSGGFGTIRMGVPNTGLLSTQAARTPYGTAAGADYGSMSVANTRNNGALQYRSPSIQGFTAVVDYLPKGSVPALTATSALVGLLGFPSQLTNDKTATIVTVSGDVAGAKLAYSRSNKIHAGLKKQNDLSAQYSIDDITVYFGYSKTNVAKATQNIAAKYVMGNIALTANYATNSDIGTSTTVGAAYSFSKTMTAYAKYQMIDADKHSSTAFKVNQTTVGLQKNF